MNQRLLKLSMLLVLVSVLLGGCGKGEPQDDDKYDTASSSNEDATIGEPTQFPDYYTHEDGIVVFDCDVVAPSDVIINSCTAKPMELDGAQIVDELMEGKEIISTDVFGEVEPIMYQYTMENFMAFVCEDFVGLTYNSAVAIFDSFRLGDEDEGYNGDKFKSNEDFEFATRESIEKEFREYLYDITGSKDFNINTYTLDADTLNAEYRVDEEIMELKGLEATTFTDEQNGYYFACRQQLQGLPVFVKLASGILRQDNDGNAPIDAYYTEEGMVLFDLTGSALYDFEIGSDRLELMKFDDVASIVNDYYNKIFTESEFVVYRATLYNYIKSNGKVIPIWIFKAFENQADGMSSCVQLEVDAVTGEVLTRND